MAASRTSARRSRVIARRTATCDAARQPSEQCGRSIRRTRRKTRGVEEALQFWPKRLTRVPQISYESRLSGNGIALCVLHRLGSHEC